MTQPMAGVILKRWVTVDASRSLSFIEKAVSWGKDVCRFALTGTFRCVMTTEVSFPRTATAVCPEPEIALKAYSRLIISSRLYIWRAYTNRLDKVDPRVRRPSNICGKYAIKRVVFSKESKAYLSYEVLDMTVGDLDF